MFLHKDVWSHIASFLPERDLINLACQSKATRLGVQMLMQRKLRDLNPENSWLVDFGCTHYEVKLLHLRLLGKEGRESITKLKINLSGLSTTEFNKILSLLSECTNLTHLEFMAKICNYDISVKCHLPKLEYLKTDTPVFTFDEAITSIYYTGANIEDLFHPMTNLEMEIFQNLTTLRVSSHDSLNSVVCRHLPKLEILIFSSWHMRVNLDRLPLRTIKPHIVFMVQSPDDSPTK